MKTPEKYFEGQTKEFYYINLYGGFAKSKRSSKYINSDLTKTKLQIISYINGMENNLK